MKGAIYPLELRQPLKGNTPPGLDIFLSVVIPACDEQDRLDDTLDSVKTYLQAQDFNSEIIIADEGSYDRTTEIIKRLDRYVYEFKEQRSVRVKRAIQHLGPGFSVARSMLRTRGRYVLCTDKDLSTPMAEVEKCWPHIRGGADIVITFPKLHRPQVRPSVKIKVMASIMKTVLRLIHVDGIWGGPCTFKLFKRSSAIRIARTQKLYGSDSGLEQLYLARAMGFAITGILVEQRPWAQRRKPDYEDPLHLLWDILRIVYLHRAGNIAQSI